jgi:hypothetical protein
VRIFIALLLLVARADALSIDASALLSADSRQVQARGQHLQAWDRSTFDAGAQYARTRGRPETYEVWLAQQTRWAHGIAVESDTRRYQTHDTFSAAVGYGRAWFTATSGVRVEYRNGRETFAKAAVTAKHNRGPLSLLAWAEALYGDSRRIDYKGQVRYRATGRLYLAARAEEVRSVRTAGISLGAVLF